MICQRCGQEIPDGSDPCPKCDRCPTDDHAWHPNDDALDAIEKLGVVTSTVVTDSPASEASPMTIKRPAYAPSPPIDTSAELAEQARAMRNVYPGAQRPTAYSEDAEELIARALDFDVEQESRLDTQKLILALAERLKKEREQRAVSAAIIRELNMALGARPATFWGWIAMRWRKMLGR